MSTGVDWKKLEEQYNSNSQWGALADKTKGKKEKVTEKKRKER